MTQTSKDNTVSTGVRFPKATMEKIDEQKGYHTRSRYILKIVEEFLAAQAQGEREDKK